ncbi:MAG: hypothetical protein NVS3B17_12230 [Vulcanimicrobiaceae bacterium]
MRGRADHVIALIYELQQQSNWCWAACVRMAASALGNSAPPQCVLATKFLPGAKGCCVDGTTDACNQPLDASDVSGVFTAVGLIADSSALGTPPTERATQSALATNDVVLLLLDISVAYHYVLIEYFRGATYQVADPHYVAPVSATWDELETAYGNGGIAGAWRVRRR